jgi:hypothetical protein
MPPLPPDYPARAQHHLEGVLQGEHEQDDSNERDIMMSKHGSVRYGASAVPHLVVLTVS